MICVYGADCTDFSSNGIGPVFPESATVTETLNGEYELTLVHPLDEAGRWRRLVEGCILRAPVPLGMTPQVDLVPQPSTGRDVYRVSTRRDPLRLRSGTGTRYKILAKYKKGTEVIVLAKTTSSWYEVSCPDGKHGYMASQYLTFVRSETSPAAATESVIESRQLRDQPFRVYRIVPELNRITVYARHVFYDLLDNMIKSYKPSSSTVGASVVQGISAGCQTEHDFTFYSDLESTAEEIEYVNINPVEALLGENGVVGKYAGELQRDWFDVFVVKRIGHDKDVQIRQGKNLLGISYDVDLTNVTTRIMPTGEDKDGELLYLPELYIDSPHLGSYIQPKWMHLAVSDAREVTRGDDKKTKAQCYTAMREAVQAEYDAGCDLPTVTLNVDFVNCAETVEYAQYAALQNIYLGDSVRAIAPRIGVEVSMRVTQYTYDCLTRKYTAMTLGTVADTIEGNMISARQLANGIISGSKLAINSVGSGQLQSGSVGSLQVQMAAIQTAHIQTAAITSALIANAAIQTAHIGDAQITNAQIADATITAAKIAQATITAACIAKAAITEAEIADAAITAAKIALATITEAHITDAAITTAKIADLAVTAAKIANATITSAKIQQAAIQSAHIEDAAITRAKIALLAVNEARIADLSVGTAKVQDASITTAKIQDLAVTAAKIANATITNAQIANATIDTAQIALGAITTALIAQGAVGTAQIADASITDAKIVELSANRITTGTLSVERLIIVGSDQSIVYTINEANGTAQLSQTTIDGGSLTQRSITADRIVTGAITANEIAAATILANNIAAGAITADKIAAGAVEASHIKAGAITTSHVSGEFGETLDLSSNESVRSTVTQRVDAALEDLSVGGVNLIRNSADYTLAADDSDAYWVAADELTPGMSYTLSVKEVILITGTAAGVTWKVVEQNSGSVHTSGMLDFTYGKQAVHFMLPETNGNWALYLYAGVSGSTTGVTVQFRQIKLEEGSFATTWSASPEDDAAQLSQLSGTVSALDSGIDGRVTTLIDAMGLTERFASAEEFLASLSEIELIRSELAQHDSDLTLTFNRLTAAEQGISTMFSSFVFGDEDGSPYLDMSASSSSIKMRLTHTRLAFVQSGKELAYFSDNKLYVTRLEVVEQISIGTSANGYLDMVTTPTGVGFKWRA
jgi:phage minor structural protein